jgi:hypothetical protein
VHAQLRRVQRVRQELQGQDGRVVIRSARSIRT